MKKHYLKTWPECFSEVRSGNKTFEVRNNDRGFAEGDIVILEEYDPVTKTYSGRNEWFSVGFVLESGFGLMDGYCAFSLVSDYSIAKMALSHAELHRMETVHDKYE